MSDALRFEVAASLSEQLQRETQSTVKLTSCEAIFPTITKFGMAALLPHQKLEVVEKGTGTLSIMADGVSTDAGYRDKILKSANKNYLVIADESGLQMPQREEFQIDIAFAVDEFNFFG